MKRRSQPQAPPRVPADHGGRWWCALILASGFLYANSLANPFVFDDQNAIVDNTTIRTLAPLRVPLSPPAETPVARRPLVNLSFALDYARGGAEAEAFRPTNLAIHLLAGLALFGVVRRALQAGAAGLADPRRATALAGAAALLWVVHPLHSETINYISQRTTSLMGLFYLLTFYCALRGIGGRRGWHAAAVAACAAGMACKESMVTAPVLVVLFERVFVFASMRQAIRSHGGFYVALAATWGVLAALMGWGGRTTVGFDAGISAWSYLLNQLPILVDYIRLAVWPMALVVDYGLPRELRLADVALPALVVLALAAATLLTLRRWPRAGFPLAAFFILLAPTSSIVPIVTEVGAERRMYLPLAALLALAVCSAGRWLELPSRPSPASGSHAGNLRQWLPAAAVAVLAVLLGAATMRRNVEYQSTLTLAQTTVERRPHGRAHYALAHALFEEGQRPEALASFRRSSPDFPPADFALGSELLVDGRTEEGIARLQRFVERMPEHPAVPSARHSIAAGLAISGKPDEAIAELRDLLSGNARLPRAQALLGRLLLLNEQPGAAVPHLERALAAFPADASIVAHLARALALAGRDGRARTILERGVIAHPGDAVLRGLLGVIIARDGDLQQALAHFRAALAIDPSSETARSNLARAERQFGAGADSVGATPVGREATGTAGAAPVAEWPEHPRSAGGQAVVASP